MALADSKGMALIIVVFVMMIFAILGWSLAVMQATDQQSSLKGFQSEQALYLAESGVQWGISDFQTRKATTSSDTDCLDTEDWITHTLSPGEFRVCTRPPEAASGETGSVVIESSGYIPSAADYTAMRQVKLMASLGNLDKCVMAAGLFDWSRVNGTAPPWPQKPYSYVEGNIQAMFYDSNGNHVYNETGIDYSNSNPRIPYDNTASGAYERAVGAGVCPVIDMQYFESAAGANVRSPDKTAAIDSISIEPGGAQTRVTLSESNFFGATPVQRNQWVGQALRNISYGAWRSSGWAVISSVIDGNTAVLNGALGWQKVQKVTIIPRVAQVSFNQGTKRYTVDFNCNLAWNVNEVVRDLSKGSWEYTDWGVVQSISHPTDTSTSVVVAMDASVSLATATWQPDDWLSEVKRYTYADSGHHGNVWNDLYRHSLWYVASDVVFDARDESNGSEINADRTGIIIEGDVAIRGRNAVVFTEKPLAYPNLATKNGNIYSPDDPLGTGDDQRISKRRFDDIIFTENGDVRLNYLEGTALYGNDIVLSGRIQLKYDADMTKIGGYSFGTTSIDWREQ